ncbi:MAG: hypothetical protein WC806_06030 [Candidatus Gracilibacteria bacterium]|jgi:hypothetical protein
MGNNQEILSNAQEDSPIETFLMTILVHDLLITLKMSNCSTDMSESTFLQIANRVLSLDEIYMLIKLIGVDELSKFKSPAPSIQAYEKILTAIEKNPMISKEEIHCLIETEFLTLQTNGEKIMFISSLMSYCLKPDKMIFVSENGRKILDSSYSIKILAQALGIKSIQQEDIPIDPSMHAQFGWILGI